MRGILRLVALVCALVAIGMSGAAGLTSSQRMLLFNGASKPTPVYSCDYTGGGLCGAELFTATGLATMFDSTGKLTTRPNNLLTYSNTFSNAAWTKSSMSVASGATDPFGTALAWTLTATGPGALLYQLQSLAGPNAIPYVWMRRKTGSGIIYLRNANNVSIDVTAQVSSSWALVYVAPTAALGSNLFLISLATNGDQIEIYSAGYSAVTYETTPRAEDKISTGAAAYYRPRIDYDPNTLAVKGLLIEEARTNYAVQSSGLTTASWNLQNATRASGATSPDGTANALTLTSSGGTVAQLYQGLTAAPTGAVTNSVFVKAGTSPYIWLQVFDNATPSIVYVRTSDMAITSTTGGATSSISALSNGWYRLTISRTVAIAGLYIAFGVSDASGSTVSTAAYTGLFYGPEHEAGSFATSYIPTAASSVTRAAETLTFSGYASNPFAILSAPESTGSYACNKYADQATANAAIAAANQWIKSVKIWPIGTPIAARGC